MLTLIRLFRTKEDLEESKKNYHQNSNKYIVVAIAAEGRETLGVYHFEGNFKYIDLENYIRKYIQKIGLKNPTVGLIQ